MDRKHQTDIIAGYYNKDHSFQRIGQAGPGDLCLYESRDHVQRLIIEWRSSEVVQARLSDQSGRIMAKDSYKVSRANIELLEAIRYSNCRNKDISFSADEIAMLHQFSEESPEKTLAMLQSVIPRIKDGQSREIVERTAEKFMLLSEKSCVELTETTRRRFRQENERSIRTRLARAKEKSENQYGRKKIQTRHREDYIL